MRSQYGKLRVPSRKEGFYRIPVGSTLFCGQSLSPGQCRSSSNGDYDLIYGRDGRLVLLERAKPAGDTEIWSSTRDARAAGRACLQDDGNLVIYGAADEVIWASNQYGSGDNYACSTMHPTDEGKLMVLTKDKNVLWKAAA